VIFNKESECYYNEQYECWFEDVLNATQYDKWDESNDVLDYLSNCFKQIRTASVEVTMDVTIQE